MFVLNLSGIQSSKNIFVDILEIVSLVDIPFQF